VVRIELFETMASFGPVILLGYIIEAQGHEGAARSGEPWSVSEILDFWGRLFSILLALVAEVVTLLVVAGAEPPTVMNAWQAGNTFLFSLAYLPWAIGKERSRPAAAASSAVFAGACILLAAIGGAHY
jgi:hypothetical protein